MTDHTQDAELLGQLEKLAKGVPEHIQLQGWYVNAPAFGRQHVYADDFKGQGRQHIASIPAGKEYFGTLAAYIAAASPAAMLKLIELARRSIPQGDEPASSLGATNAKVRKEMEEVAASLRAQRERLGIAQGDDLPPLPWDDSEANRANKITVRVGDLSDAMREYGAACRAGRAKGEDARDAS